MLVYDFITIAATEFQPRRTLRRCWARISGTNVLILVAIEDGRFMGIGDAGE